MNKISIRVAEFTDVEALYNIEKLCFPQEHYPKFFFIQTMEIFSNVLLLAEDKDKTAVGYILASSKDKNLSSAWILSMAVIPNKRKHGMGTSLLQAVEETLKFKGIKEIFLSVASDNKEALALYYKFGFKEDRFEPNYFGKSEPRIIMSKILSPFKDAICPPVLNPDHLLSEASTSVSFSSVLFAVSAAILAFLAPRSDIGLFITPVLLLCLTIFSSFYSVLFYANTSGSLSRIYDVDSTTKPLRYGNSVSEYLGVYPLICAFPLIVWGITKNYTITVIACTVDIGGFLFYQTSGFDLLSRVLPSRVTQVTVTLCLILLVVSSVVTTIISQMYAHYTSIGIFLCVCFYLFIIGIIGNEKRNG